MASPHFTLRQLEIFMAVLRTGRVRRAAERLHLSQAAVSQALTELAAALDTTLFERRGRAIVPTAGARQLARLAGEPLSQLAALPEHFAGDATPKALAGHIRLAASSTIARYILPAALARLRRRHPALTIHVLSGNSARVERRIGELDADIGFIEGPAQRSDLDVHPWGRDVLAVIAPPDYPVDTIAAATLQAHPWVFREPGSGTRAVFEQSLALAGLPVPRAALEIDDSGAIVRAVAAGAGLACVSRLAARQAAASAAVRFVTLDALRLARPLWRLGRPGTGPQTPLVARVVAALDEALADGDDGAVAEPAL